MGISFCHIKGNSHVIERFPYYSLLHKIHVRVDLWYNKTVAIIHNQATAPMQPGYVKVEGQSAPIVYCHGTSELRLTLCAVFQLVSPKEYIQDSLK